MLIILGFMFAVFKGGVVICDSCCVACGCGISKLGNTGLSSNRFAQLFPGDSLGQAIIQKQGN